MGNFILWISYEVLNLFLQWSTFKFLTCRESYVMGQKIDVEFCADMSVLKTPESIKVV